MLYRFLASRGFISIFGVSALAAAAVAAYLTVVAPPRATQSYCAIMPDAIGLYPGNHVTMLGITVGTVTAVRPENGTVRVDFTVERDHPLKGTVSATTFSDTLAADRNLAVLSDGKAVNRWNPGTCITKTLTPKSMTRTLAAITDLATQLNADGGHAVSGSVNALNNATVGTGPRMNELIGKLGAALNSPDAAIGHIGELIDALASLSSSALANWPEIKATLEGFGPLFDQTDNEILSEGDVIGKQLRVLVPWINGLARQYGGPLLGGIDAVAPYLHLLAAHIGSVRELIGMVPAVVSAFTRSTDPVTGAPTVVYAAPRVAVPQGDADRLCAAVNAAMPGKCASAVDGMADLNLAGVVLGLAGAR
ncbi:MlaD family protein [Nocardia nova]|jgi:virulence factor Mce-like protein|uniref:MlaD family protein n=1 Tax=Nocardia nova TaxID=37330 RepID=UPI0018939462|nr:MlaD family protein [Nocardia nova]MBF6150094.1 MCE family protein [Nocardia nova]MDN2495216.1 MCE family protein [Nocardia nova]